MNERCYGRQLSLVFQQSITLFQKALEQLENGSIIVSFLEGKTRSYQFNPRYAFLKEYYERKIRKRPHRKGKPLK